MTATLSPELLSPESLRSEYLKVAESDPLYLDDVILKIPFLNADGDTSALVNITNTAIGTIEFGNLDRNDSLAALRDLDFLLSSIIRHDPDAINQVDRVEDVLTTLAVNADSVPRGTVYTYAIANPVGERQRTFTGTDEERLFIEAVSDGTIALDGALVEMANASYGSSSDMVNALASTADSLDVMIASIINVKKVISPQFFTNEMRPYFEPLHVGGKKYTGAGGAQLQLVALDFMLWGANETDLTYQGYLAENWQYLTPAQKAAAEMFVGQYGGSLVDHVAGQNDAGTNQLGEETVKVLRKLRKFRYPHRKLAQDNFKVRSGGSVGSGSYDASILDVLIDKTENAMATLGGGHEKN